MPSEHFSRVRLWPPFQRRDFATALATLVEQFLDPTVNARDIIRDLELQIMAVRDRRDDALGR